MTHSANGNADSATTRQGDPDASSDTPPILNIAAYKFVALEDLDSLRVQLRTRAQSLGLRGTILLAPEGMNCFLAGLPEPLETFLLQLRQIPGMDDLTIKRSRSAQVPFKRMLVKIKREIIAFGIQGIDPQHEPSAKIEPSELRRWLDEGRQVH
ncbi:MAG: hypothetical protein AAFP69_22850, partial [Planctomycetota bacterium]